MKNFSLVDRHAKSFANKLPIRVVVSPALNKMIGTTDVEQLAMFWLLVATFTALLYRKNMDCATFIPHPNMDTNQA